MLEEINNVMRIYGMILPAPVRQIIKDLGSEVDRLGTKMQEIETKLNQGAQNASK
jgi:hypothetical protein